MRRNERIKRFKTIKTIKIIKTIKTAAIMLALMLLLVGCRGLGAQDSSVIDKIYNDEEAYKKQGGTFNLNSSDQKVDNDKNRYDASIEFGGIATIWELETDKEISVSMSGSISVENGKAKLVVVDNDGSTFVMMEKDSASGSGEEGFGSGFSLSPGKTRIRLVATDKTLINISIKADGGVWKKIGE